MPDPKDPTPAPEHAGDETEPEPAPVPDFVRLVQVMVGHLNALATEHGLPLPLSRDVAIGVAAVAVGNLSRQPRGAARCRPQRGHGWRPLAAPAAPIGKLPHDHPDPAAATRAGHPGTSRDTAPKPARGALLVKRQGPRGIWVVGE